VILLAVHSTSAQLGVAVTSDGQVLAESVLPPGREHLENLALMIKDVTARARVGLKNIDGLGVAIGPGSFSGIRIGLATVKGMALALKKPVAGIPSLEILAWQALKEGESGASLIDARRREIYVGMYKKSTGSLTQLNSPRLISSENLNELIEKLPDAPVLCGDSAVEPAMQAVKRVARKVIVTPSPATCAVLAWRRLNQGWQEDLHSIAPIYIRRSDAEEKRSAGQGREQQSGEPFS
jgi:tRNA threonylcarbamoyladenosine biosynthesis protein TsaB